MSAGLGEQFIAAAMLEVITQRLTPNYLHAFTTDMVPFTAGRTYPFSPPVTPVIADAT